MTPRKPLAQKRPAEVTAAGGGTVGTVLTALFSNQKWLSAIPAVVGALPGVVTWLRSNGGVKGAFRSLWG